MGKVMDIAVFSILTLSWQWTIQKEMSDSQISNTVQESRCQMRDNMIERFCFREHHGNESEDEKQKGCKNGQGNGWVTCIF